MSTENKKRQEQQGRLLKGLNGSRVRFLLALSCYFRDTLEYIGTEEPFEYPFGVSAHKCYVISQEVTAYILRSTDAVWMAESNAYWMDRLVQSREAFTPAGHCLFPFIFAKDPNDVLGKLFQETKKVSGKIWLMLDIEGIFHRTPRDENAWGDKNFDYYGHPWFKR